MKGEPSHEPPSKAAKERREKLDPEDWVGVRLLGRLVPAVRTPEGSRALETDLRPASASMRRFGPPFRPGRAAGARPADSTWTGSRVSSVATGIRDSCGARRP